MQRYSTNDANLIPVTLCVRRILARPALLAAAPPSFERAGDEFRAVRFKLGLSSLEWGLALGYAGKPDNIRTVTLIGVELSAKRLELMRELLPGAVEVAAR